MVCETSPFGGSRYMELSPRPRPSIPDVVDRVSVDRTPARRLVRGATRDSDLTPRTTGGRRPRSRFAGGPDRDRPRASYVDDRVDLDARLGARSVRARRVQLSDGGRDGFTRRAREHAP